MGGCLEGVSPSQVLALEGLDSLGTMVHYLATPKSGAPLIRNKFVKGAIQMLHYIMPLSSNLSAKWQHFRIFLLFMQF